MTEQNFTHISFEHYLKSHKLMGAKCQACDRLYLPPRPMCTQCFNDNMTWTEMPEEGELVAFTVIHIAPTAMLEAGYGRDKPYISGIVQLENGLSISAQILGLDVAKPEEIEIGQALKAEYIERGEDENKSTFLAFRAIRAE